MKNLERHQLEGDFESVKFGENASMVQAEGMESVLNKKNRTDFLYLIEEFSRGNRKFENLEKGDLKMELVSVRTDEGGIRSRYFKLEYAGKSYFVKKIQPREHSNYGGGSQELEDMVEAKKLLVGVGKVEIPEYKLGYSDNRNSYVISEWNEALHYDLETYIKQIIPHDIENHKKVLDLNKRFEDIKEILSPHFFEVKKYNMAYDDKRDVIIVFDLVKKTSKGGKKYQKPS